MMNVYYSPEKFGLEIVGEVEWTGGYEFDKHVVWYQPATGRYLLGHDSGCSCPSPFEHHGLDDLHALKRGIAGVEELREALTEHDKGQYRYEPWESLRSDAVELLERLAVRILS